MNQGSVKPGVGRGARWAWIAVIVVLAAAFFLFVFGQRTTRTGALPATVSVPQASAMRDGGGFVLDVRQPEEWEEVHVPGSTLIPLGELEDRVAEVPRDREIVVICRSGNRSQRGRDILLGAGFDRVTSMDGGIRKWEAEGRPTVAGP